MSDSSIARGVSVDATEDGQVSIVICHEGDDVVLLISPDYADRLADAIHTAVRAIKAKGGK